jgi:hypothetical protein
MITLLHLTPLFFRARKNYAHATDQFFVEGDPNLNGRTFNYRLTSRNFHFVTYKEVIVAALLWTKRLYGNMDIDKIMVHHIETNPDKEWFNVQLIYPNPGILIDGEQYNPYVNVQYSYDNPDEVSFDIGFYRYACSNGLLKGKHGVRKLRIDPSNLFEIPFWINKCLLEIETERFRKQINLLKRTKISEPDMRRWISRYFRRWNISDDIIDSNLRELGENAYALLNIITNAASNFGNNQNEMADMREENRRRPNFLGQSMLSERANRQLSAGRILDRLVEEIMKQNEYNEAPIDINSDDFSITEEDISRLMKDNNNTYRGYYLDLRNVRIPFI